MLERLPALPTAPADAVAEAENLIGYRLPPLLRRLYLEAGNGGFGPGYGILGLRDGHRGDTRRTALGLYREAHGTSSTGWSFLPASLLPICHWGCGIYSFTDCPQPQGPSQPVLVHDPDTQQWRGATEQEYAQWIAEMEDPAI